MILLGYLPYLILLALFVFVVALYVKLYCSTRNLLYSFKGLVYFMVTSLSFPFSYSNHIYRRRSALNRKINLDKNLDKEQRERLKKIIKSRVRLYFIFTSMHVLEFPNFIEGYCRAYSKWYKEKNSNKDKNNDSSINPLLEIKRYGIGDFPNLFNSLKEKAI
ncbi:hypothetical protein ACFSKI_01590 [Pseudogracilibacillus auburnensis]|uniref:Uncharacterized protein n=1 Tax=Pseudogracilibacillus auburnensis TaxID=1494959 RepID=A0A2V3VGJ3_9BACI|nr:hypothetical protein [Pseudogracilibacillus auburnensis]PXW80936.1 hypothetical protein DFR56_12445 [Pseudogracilibacillus auburnensis]